jgi:hypothetical protein
MQPKPSKSPENDLLKVVRRTMWLDQEALFMLGEEQIDDKGACISSWAFTSFEANPTLDPGLFVYLPALDTDVSFSGLRELWQTLEKTAPFAIFEPGGTTISSFYHSNRLIPRRPEYDADKGVVRQEYYSRADPQKRAIALTILEGKPGAITAFVGDTTKDGQIDLSSATGYYREQGTTRQLVFDRDETRIALLAQAEISKDDLIQVAKSLLPLHMKLPVPSGKVAVLVPQDRNATAAWRPGDLVDVSVTFVYVDVDNTYQTPVVTPIPNAAPHTVTRTIIKAAQVLQVNVGVVQLAVSPQDATTLNWAIDSKLTMTLLPHSADK